MLSFPEILVILLVAVVVLGPKRLPETARKLGHWVGLFKRASEEFKRELMTMDRVVDDTLNRAVSNVDQLVPDELNEVMPPADADLADLMGIPAEPPIASPDDLWDTPPVPGGLPAEPVPASESEGDAQASEVAPPAESITTAQPTAPAASVVGGDA